MQSDFCNWGKLTIIPSIIAVKPQLVLFVLILENPLLIANHFFYTYLWVCLRIRHECQCCFPWRSVSQWQIKQSDIAKLLKLLQINSLVTTPFTYNNILALFLAVRFPLNTRTGDDTPGFQQKTIIFCERFWRPS